MLCLDLGTARIGVAVSDPTGSVCTPLDALERSAHGNILARIAKLAAAEGVTRIVLGLPVTLEGRHGTKAAESTRFRDDLITATDIPVVLWDERLTTVEAVSRLKDAGARRSRDKGRVDSAAAAVLLESYLAALRRTSR